MLTHTGTQIRSTVGIATIAALICFWIANGKQAIKPYFFFVLGLLPSCFIWKAVEMQMGCAINSNLTFPITHWIMMGMNPKNRGKWSSEMYSFTAALPTYAEKMSGNLTQLFSQIQEMGLSGLCRFFAEKVKIIWTDGTTATRTDLSLVIRYSDLYEYTVGSKRFVTNYIAQMMRCTTLIGVIPGLIAFKRSCRTAAMAVPVSMFGYMLFYLFWEVHEKYIFMFLPVMILISVVGIAFVHKEFCIERPFVQRPQFVFGIKEPVSIYSAIQKTIVLIQIITVLIAVFYSDAMIKNIGNRYETRLNQPSKNTNTTLLTADVIQTLVLDQSFNRISVQFAKKDNVLNGQQYLFRLESDNEILYERTFWSDDIKTSSGDNFVFSFDTITPQEATQYQVRLRAMEDNENNIAVCHTRNNTKDYYDGGAFLKNGVVDGDMTFTVSQKFEGTLMSKNVFYMLVGGSLTLEMFLYCWAKKRYAESKKRNRTRNALKECN